jgi:hypothetical protein
MDQADQITSQTGLFSDVRTIEILAYHNIFSAAYYGIDGDVTEVCACINPLSDFI